MSYILSSANRYYAAVETTFGQAQPVGSGDRLAGAHLQIRQTTLPGNRRDKNGSRSFTGTAGVPRTAFECRAELTSSRPDGLPWCGALVEAALGGAAVASTGLTIASMTDAATVHTQQPHGLLLGVGVSLNTEVRFVTRVVDVATFQMNAPFAAIAQAATALNRCISYGLGNRLPSLTIYDYWDPTTAISRLVSGASVDQLLISATGSVPELTFSGPAADVVDPSSLTPRSGLAIFPQEPEVTDLQYTTVQGNAGQVWLGQLATRRFTMTAATIRLRNNIQLRTNDMGSDQPLAIQAGKRLVDVEFTLAAQSDDDTDELYQLARARGTMPILLQLGSAPGQMIAVFLPAVVLQIPRFDDSGDWLTWHFTGSWAKGLADDEIRIAFA